MSKSIKELDRTSDSSNSQIDLSYPQHGAELAPAPASNASNTSPTGNKTSLKRTHTFWSSMAYQTTILCSWSCNITLYYEIFTLGGPAALVWGTVLVTIGQLLIMASLAEYYSLWPSAGGQQFYTHMVAPERYRYFLSYTVGWCILLGEVSVAAGCALNSANIVGTFVQIVHPHLSWKPYMTFLLYCGFLLLPFLIGVFAGARYQPALQMFGAAFNIMCGLTWAIVFLAMAPKTSARFIFTEFINTSGWTSDGWVFVLSLYVPIYGLYGSDGVMHLSDEMKNPSQDGPRVMIWSMVWAGVTAWVSAVIMCYTVGTNWESRLEMLSSYLSWFMDATRSIYGGGVFCAIIMMGLNLLIVLNQSTASARLIWKMARDRAFPRSDYLSHISPYFNIPIRGLVAFFIINVLIGLIVLGSDLAFNAILSGGGIALQVSYCIPILCVVLRGRSKVLREGRQFDLGNFWGYVVNLLSLAWSVVVVLFYVFPQYLPVVGEISDMNWAIAILGGVVILASMSWFWTARRHYMRGASPVLFGG